MKPLRKVLVANRGEIAVRVMRACRELGIHTVAVFSEADRDAMHVRFADEAHELGPAKPAESYLNLDRILAAAADSGADAIHPGYGFFAENSAAARRIEEAGLTFIGPTSEQIRLMGDKLEARRVAALAAVPMLPAQGPLDDADAVAQAADQLGFPLLVKPVAGGGGIGTAIVSDQAALARAYSLACRLGHQAFGRATVYLERCLPDARHVEIQIAADHHGQAVALGERECSLQRRYQKLVEESPSTAVDEQLRREMAAAAVRIAKAIGYHNMGTMEFLLDAENRAFYFLEMNTRIQVEHPVTEMVTGIDLVREQLRVATDLPLSFGERDVECRGHAIECRICSEDPLKNFMPSSGQISALTFPAGPGVRVDSGVSAGCAVTMYYDPLLCKVIVWDSDRERATARMRRALSELRVEGVRTTRELLLWVMSTPEWNQGRIHTRLLERELVPRFKNSRAIS
jgi:acetyl-CoA carboxylase biotin carboxylase subunit